MIRYFAAAAAAVVGLGAAVSAPAFAQDDTVGEVVVHGTNNPDVEVKSQVVRFADLDLTRPDDARILLHRITYAARNVCSPAPVKELWQYPDYNRCMAEAMDSAVDQANS